MKKIFSNKKIVLGTLTMLLMLAIIVVSSFFPFIFDPTRIGNAEFLTDQMIIVAITIMAMVSMMFISQAGNAQNPKSEIAKAKVEFDISIKKITEHTAFYQWIKKVLQVKDRRDIAEKGMLRLGIDFKVWDLSDTEIKSLTVAQKYGDTFFKPLTKQQIQGVFDLKKKVKKIKFVAPNYYTSCKSIMADKNLSEIASAENVKKIATVMFQLIWKIVFSFIFAAILASLVIDLTEGEGETAQEWMRFLSRMFAFIKSSFLGYMLGCKINDLDAFYISKRVEAHTLYLEDKTFKPVDEAKEAFIERVKNENKLLIEKGAENE